MLLLVHVEELFPGLAGAGIRGGDAELVVAVLLHLALAQGHLEGGGEVHIAAAGGVGVAVGHAGLGAAGNGVVEGLGEGAALGGVQRHDFLVVAELGEAGAVLDGLGDVVQVFIGGEGVHAGGEVRIVQRELPLGAEEEVGEVVGGVKAFAGLSADGHGFPVGIAFVEGAALWADVHVDELGHADPHALEELHGGLFGDHAGFDVLLVVGIQVLVHAAVGNGGAGLLLDAGEHLGEPLGLHGFVEVRGGLGGDLVGDLGHLQQLGLADGIGACGGLAAGFFGIAVGPEDDGVADEDDGVEEGLLFGLGERALDVHGVDLGLGFSLDAVEAADKDLLIIRHPLDGGAEGRGLVDHEAGDEAFGIDVGQLVHPFRKAVVQVFMIGLALPVGGDLFHDDLGVFHGDGGGGLLAGGQVAHGDVEEVAVQLRIEDAVAAELAAGAAEQELVFVDGDGDVLGDVHESLGPAKDEGLALGLGRGLGEVQGAFDVDDGGLPVKAPDHLEHALVGVFVLVFLAVALGEDAVFLRGMAGALFRVHVFGNAHGALLWVKGLSVLQQGVRNAHCFDL